MMKKEIKQSLLWVFVLKYNYIFWGGILLIAVAKIYISPPYNVDIGKIGSKNIKTLSIVDSTYNGFDVYFSNSYLLTDDRILMLSSSKKVTDFFNHIASSYQSRFQSLLYTDPYEVVDWIKSMGIPDSIKIYKIEGVGKQKHSLYLRPNPYDTSKVSLYSPSRPYQGMVFLNDYCIRSYSLRSKQRPYMYLYSNDGVPSYSSTDEQFSHISKFEAQFK